jgi:hypothetical protein
VLAAPQLAAPALVEAADREVVTALVAMLRCCNAQVAALDQQLTSRFSAHPDAAIVRSQPGLGVVLGARVLGEFGDAPDRSATAKGRKAFAGTARSPAPRGCARWCSPGRRAISGWWMPALCGAFAALTASPGTRRCYDAHRARGHTHHQALRALGNRLVGILHGCLVHRVAYQEQVAWPTVDAAAWPGSGGAGGAPLGDAGHLDCPGAGGAGGRDAARSSAMGRPGSSAAGSGGRRRRHHPVGEFGRRPGSR